MTRAAVIRGRKMTPARHHNVLASFDAVASMLDGSAVEAITRITRHTDRLLDELRIPTLLYLERPRAVAPRAPDPEPWLHASHPGYCVAD